jgi:hypothetical protein
VRRCTRGGCAAEGRVATTPGGLTRSSPTLGGGGAQRGDRMITNEQLTRARTAEPKQSGAQHKPSHLSAARTLAWPSRVFSLSQTRLPLARVLSLSLKHVCRAGFLFLSQTRLPRVCRTQTRAQRYALLLGVRSFGACRCMPVTRVAGRVLSVAASSCAGGLGRWSGPSCSALPQQPAPRQRQPALADVTSLSAATTSVWHRFLVPMR